MATSSRSAIRISSTGYGNAQLEHLKRIADALAVTFPFEPIREAVGLQGAASAERLWATFKSVTARPVRSAVHSGSV
ncbi:hypothetical protein OHT76_42020 [Streptomyces sp. NBC_00287]|uniref:hypothetical protein n=1 Tax=Streptomyces sp. NBC_00287 TaxID=2975702 RepID=UPI002E2E51C0|nr:hypothetical protein [Streptomyces sp. NBC_00287]